MNNKYKVIVRGGEVDLREMTRAEVVELKDEISVQLYDIKANIAETKRLVYVNGEHAAPGWFLRAEAAQKHAGQSILKINRWLGEMREAKKQHAIELARLFRDVAYEQLDKEVYFAIENEALDMMRTSEEQEAR